MKLLVYGAGVIGGYLASVLCGGPHDITVLARNKQYETLKNDGLRAKNYFTRKTTVSHPRVIDRLKPDDRYDIVFAVMQFGQLRAILPELAQNVSPMVVLVGNNMDSAEMEKYIHANSPVKKTVVFGFQATGGERVDGHYTYVSFGKPCMHAGSISPQSQWLPALSNAFDGVSYSVAAHFDMDAWYKAHAAAILPVAYLCYKHDCDLRKATSADINRVLDASLEGLLLLKKQGVAVEQSDIDAYQNKRPLMYIFMWLCAHTRLGVLAASRHSQNAVGEMTALSSSFDALLQSSPAFPTPAWLSLRRHLPECL